RSGAVLAWHTIGTSRSIAIPGFSEQASARYSAVEGQVFGEIGYGMSFGNTAVEPFAGLAWVTGGVAALGALVCQLLHARRALGQHLPHAERHDVDAARVARVAARLWHGDAKRVAYPDRARRRTRRSGWRPAVAPADEGRRCLCRSAREQCTRSFGQGQFLVAVLKHPVECARQASLYKS